MKVWNWKPRLLRWTTHQNFKMLFNDSNIRLKCEIVELTWNSTTKTVGGGIYMTTQSRANQYPINIKSIFSTNIQSIFPINISINILSIFCMKKWLKCWLSNQPTKSMSEKTNTLFAIISMLEIIQQWAKKITKTITRENQKENQKETSKIHNFSQTKKTLKTLEISFWFSRFFKIKKNHRGLIDSNQEATQQA